MERRKPAKGTIVGGMRDLHGKTPYLQVIDDPRATTGKGSTQPTIFGVVGRTKMDPYQTSLQHIVMNTKTPGGPAPDLLADRRLLGHHGNTERGCLGPPPATYIPGIHHGQVPYPGHFMSAC